MDNLKNIKKETFIWEEEFSIHAKDIDFNGKLKFYCICGYFFELAARHANQLHFGFKDLSQENVYWVLSRLHVKILNYPGIDQKIKIQTWHKGIDRLFGLRDFRIIDKEGQVQVLAASAWLILDKNTGRPIRPDRFKELHTTKMDYHAIDNIPEKLEPLSGHHKVRYINPGYTELDINFHVNAGRYVAWIQDLYTPDFYRNFQISEFKINYLNETRFGSKVQILIKEESSRENLLTDVEGRIDGTENPAFRAHLLWSKTNS